MDMAHDPTLVQDAKDRLADRYTSSELCELLEVPVEDIIEAYWEMILDKGELFEEEIGSCGGDVD